jgi:hypothetical protein
MSCEANQLVAYSHYQGGAACDAASVTISIQQELCGAIGTCLVHG